MPAPPDHAAKWRRWKLFLLHANYFFLSLLSSFLAEKAFFFKSYLSKEWKLFFSIMLEKIFFCHFCFDFKLFLLPAAAVR